jgi:hypothetical protein
MLGLLRRLRPGALFTFKRAGSKRGKSSDGAVASLKRRTPKRTRPARRKASEQEPAPPDETRDAPAPRVRVEPAAEEHEAPTAKPVVGSGSSFQGLSRRERRLLKQQLREERAPLRRSA